jgi:hypothetical protein
MDAGLRRFLRAPLLVLAGLGCGISPAFFGYFDLSVWGPISLGVLAVAVALLVAEPAVPTGLGGLAALALLLLGGWCLLSMGWAESADRALTEGDRWVLYAAFLLVLMLLVRDREDGEIFIAAALVGILCIAGYDLVKMLAGEGQDLFGETRLLEPLGYINGMGGFFLLGLWPLIAIAERARAHALAGLAAGGATLLCALVLLTESRGTLFAFGASALAILALFPGRRRRAWLLLAVLAGLAIAWGPITDVTQPLAHGQIAPDADLIRRGTEWSVGVSALVAIVWGVGGWGVDSLRSRSPASARSLPVVSSVLLGGIAAAAAVAVLAAVHDPVQKVRDQYDAFTSLHKVQAGSRLTAGGGNRYDYWRIAWHQFTDHPLDGVGAGNFDRTYFLERRTASSSRRSGRPGSSAGSCSPPSSPRSSSGCGDGRGPGPGAAARPAWRSPPPGCSSSGWRRPASTGSTSYPGSPALRWVAPPSSYRGQARRATGLAARAWGASRSPASSASSRLPPPRSS